jgi:hypothetical protein
MLLFSVKIECKVASIHGESNHLNVLNLVVDAINTGDHAVDTRRVLRVHVVADESDRCVLVGETVIDSACYEKRLPLTNVL